MARRRSKGKKIDETRLVSKSIFAFSRHVFFGDFGLPDSLVSKSIFERRDYCTRAFCARDECLAPR